MQEYYVIGTMSGTSLDGLDLAYCKFSEKNLQWQFEIIQTTCYQYEHSWQKKLMNATHLSAVDLAFLNIEFGQLMADYILDFVQKNKIEKIDFISSHGHTIFHQPEKKLTLQIGAGAQIAASTGITCVCDFRTLDVAYGGQGAPLVPIGDKLLFHQYDFCLNIGGFANISFDDFNKRIAFDICPANIILNHYLADKNLRYDDKGNIARTGKCNKALFEKLNMLPYYSKSHPKSLGKEWVMENIFPIVDSFELNEADCLATLVEHIAFQIATVFNSYPNKSTLLLTGGGAYHDLLMEKISMFTKLNFELPSNKLIEFKEAVIFAFLGVLRITNNNNCLASVTGAKQDSCAGTIYLAT